MSVYILTMMVIIIVANHVYYLDANFIQSRAWHEEFVANRHGGNPKVLYPRYKVCLAPREKSERIKLRQRGLAQSHHAEVTWGTIIALYTSDSGSEIYNWDFWKKEPDPDKATRLNQFIAILVFLGAFIVIFMIFVFLVPIIGSSGFQFYSLIWYVIFHPEIRRICRRMFIAKEKLSRKHMQLLVPKNVTGITKQAKRQFRLPFVLREYNEEEVPAELIQSEEESEGEISSDGFENLLIRKGEGQTINLEDTQAIVQLLVTTEEELAIEHRSSAYSISSSRLNK